MALPIIEALRTCCELKESVLHSGQELAHRANIYGVVRVSNSFMGQKCHCSKRTFQRHAVCLVEGHILKKVVSKKRVNGKLYNEINVYRFIIPWHKNLSPTNPMDKMSTNLPPQEERKEKFGTIQGDIDAQEKTLRLYCTPGSLAHEAAVVEVARLKALLKHEERRML